jgi:hypothetical protein
MSSRGEALLMAVRLMPALLRSNTSGSALKKVRPVIVLEGDTPHRDLYIINPFRLLCSIEIYDPNIFVALCEQLTVPHDRLFLFRYPKPNPSLLAISLPQSISCAGPPWRQFSAMEILPRQSRNCTRRIRSNGKMFQQYFACGVVAQQVRLERAVKRGFSHRV